jgi:exopolysaccharide biosynthesis polyprenyl glycosylphosphotransferase
LFGIDCVVIGSSWYLAWWLRQIGWPVKLLHGAPDFGDYLPTLVLIPPVWWSIFRAFGLFQPRRLASRATELFNVVKGSALQTLILLGASYMLFKANLSRVSLGIFWISSTAGLLGVRVLFRESMRFARRRGLGKRTALIVGVDELALNLQRQLRAHPELGLGLAGFVSTGEGEVAVEEEKIIGKLEDLQAIVRRTRTNSIFVSLTPGLHERVAELVGELQDEMVSINLVSSFYKHALPRGRVELFEGMPVLALDDARMVGWNRVFKRSFDLVVSLALLMVAAPVIAAIALISRIRNGSPVFFFQERMGLDGRTFKLIKFRTMRTDAEPAGAVWSRKNDARCTAMGGFLRRTSLDELPQLWNVFKGEMSLVGPRPERPVFVETFRADIPRYMRRHRVKAGLTGWAQVHGLRGASSVQQRLQYDLFYIEHWSMLLDLRILWRTACGGFINKNA